MKIHLIFVEVDAEAYELHDAWDEYCVEQNPEGFEEALAGARKAGETRMCLISVPDHAVESLFRTRELPVSFLKEKQ